MVNPSSMNFNRFNSYSVCMRYGASCMLYRERTGEYNHESAMVYKPLVCTRHCRKAINILLEEMEIFL